MKLIRKAGATSEIWQIFIADSSSTTGAGLTGLVFNSGSLVAYYHRDTDTTATAISLVTMTVGTFTSSGFKEIDATNMPGWYQFCPPNAALAAGARSCAIHLKGATNMAPLPIEVDLDSQVDVTSWNGTAVSSPATAGIPDVNVKNMNNVAATAITTIKAVQGLTTADTIATYTGNTPQTGDAYARIGAAGVGLTNLGDTRIANLDAAVSTRSTYAGGAVASVTGNVGGNVTGSVGSVIAPVATTSNVKKNQSLSGFEFVMTDSTNHAPVTGKTVTATRSLDGAAFSACANSVTEIANGWYTINLATTDMNGNNVALRFTATGCDDQDILIITQP